MIFFYKLRKGIDKVELQTKKLFLELLKVRIGNKHFFGISE